MTARPGLTTYLDEVEERLGPIDVLVNNAGIMGSAPSTRSPTPSFIRQIEIDLHAVIHGTKEAMRRMRPRGTGTSSTVAFTAGMGGFAGGATCRACKHGVVGLSKAVRAELRGTGVEVSVILTPAGRRQFRRAAAAHVAGVYERFVERLTAELDQLTGALSSLL